MGDRMTPIPFIDLMKSILNEKKKYDSVFGVRKSYKANPDRTISIFGEKAETPFGPAAGPNTQLAQNIVASYYAGSRFFELKTVQKLDGEDLPVAKPCINATDECYNVEWSTELYVPQAFDEYVKAWWALKIISKEFGLGAADGFIFNMSVGYDLEGIKTEKIDRFIEGLKDASNTPVWAECREAAMSLLPELKNVTADDINAVSPRVCRSITLSTLHGCPPQEIERIATYLIEEKGLNTFIKCNPTLLGYDYARKTLDDMGYDYIAFTDFHFKDDLQYEDAVPMLERLQARADSKGVEFGVKITNTFPVDIKAGELPGNEMYMSGKSLYPLSLSVAKKLTDSFNGKLRISYSGGADYYNIDRIYDTGICPITLATTVLKPGGYERMVQIAKLLESRELGAFKGVSAEKLTALVEEAKKDRRHIKAVKPLPSRKVKGKAPLIDCYMASCEAGCPINQDITTYMELNAKGRFEEALFVILDKNPLPFITGTICAHRCMTKCSRNFYDSSVEIRESKLLAAKRAYDKVLADIKEIVAERTEAGDSAVGGRKVAVIGAGPAGIAAAYFLARAGIDVTVFEKEQRAGGVVRNIIPEFRISSDDIEKDVELAKAAGAKFEFGKEIKELNGLKEQGFGDIILAIGAGVRGRLRLESGEALNAIDFLRDFKEKGGKLDLGTDVVVIGGGNTAMDTARAAKRVQGVKNVSLLYRRTKRYMPADAEELELAIQDGVEFKELLSPVKIEDGRLVCKVCVLGEPDASGRREPVETEQIAVVSASTVIAAVGEKTDGKFYESLGIKINEKGRPIVGEGNRAADGIYIIGDGLNGPATVVEGIRDARKAADAIIKELGTVGCAACKNVCGSGEFRREWFKANCAAAVKREGFRSESDIKAVHGVLSTGKNCEGSCLGCNTVCENCVEVCPNRANVSVKVPGMESAQVIHIDSMCNECGNCLIFCPYEGAPYKDKFTFFANTADFENSENRGFVVIDEAAGLLRVRLDEGVFDVKQTKDTRLPKDLAALIKAFLER